MHAAPEETNQRWGWWRWWWNGDDNGIAHLITLLLPAMQCCGMSIPCLRGKPSSIGLLGIHSAEHCTYWLPSEIWFEKCLHFFTSCTKFDIFPPLWQIPLSAVKSCTCPNHTHICTYTRSTDVPTTYVQTFYGTFRNNVKEIFTSSFFARCGEEFIAILPSAWLVG